MGLDQYLCLRIPVKPGKEEAYATMPHSASKASEGGIASNSIICECQFKIKFKL